MAISPDGHDRGFWHDLVDLAVHSLRDRGGWWAEVVDVPEWYAKLLGFPDSAHRGKGSKTRAYLIAHSPVALLWLPVYLRRRFR